MRSLTVSAVTVLLAVLVASGVHAVDLHPGDLVVTRGPTFREFQRSAAVVRVDPLTGAETVVSLLDETLGNVPTGVAIDANGDLLVTEMIGPSGGRRTGGESRPVPDIVRVDPVTGTPSVVVSFHGGQ